MSDSSYVTDSVYQSLARPDQSPIQMSYVAANAGFVPPDPTREFSYVDLGCSTGETVNLLAAAYPYAHFQGVDINPGAIDKARRDAAAAQLANVSFTVGAFSEIAATGLGWFDYITCQGTYSWLDSRQKQALFATVDRCLKPDGLFLVHYVPFGNAPVTTMWHALRQMIPADGRDSTDRMATGIALLEQLEKLGATYFRNSPQATAILKDVASFRRDDTQFTNVTHNALAEHYQPAYFDELENTCDGLGLRYCGDIDLRMNDADQCIPPTIRKQYDNFTTAKQRETFKDFCLPRIGRADIFARNNSRDEHAAANFLKKSLSVTLTEPGNMVQTAIQGLRNSNFFDFESPAARDAFQRLERDDALFSAVPKPIETPEGEQTDALHKLLTCTKIRLCMPQHFKSSPDKPQRWAPASTYNSNALLSAPLGTGPLQLAAPALGGSVSLARPGALIALDTWQYGGEENSGDSYQRVLQQLKGTELDQPGNLPDFFASEHSFADFRSWFIRQRMPLLVKFGAMTIA